MVAFHYRSYGTFFYNKIGSIISIGDLPTTNIIEPICLHELISKEEGLVEDIPRLRKYFKTKFRNRILDYIRKQESQKRRYDKEPYEEVGEISHRISEGGLWLDDYYLFHETLRRYRKEQSKEKQEELERVLRNDVFEDVKEY